MKTCFSIAFGCALGLCSLSVSAQESMPGMQMPMTTTPGHHPDPAKPSQPRQQPKATPKDLGTTEHPTAGRKAGAHSASEPAVATQQADPVEALPADASDPLSLTLPFQTLQEPEAAGFHTGSDLPAPELLRDVVKLPPMTLDQFLALAEQANPTLAQAQRAVDRSQQQARQAGLPPDPTVGYSGEHIRGGSYHGGEEGAFFSQDIVLGHKLALRRDVYRAEGRSNEFAVQMQRARIHGDIALAFFQALASQEAVVLRDRLLKVALDAETNAHELERVGQADAPAVLEAEVTAEQAKIEFEGSQRTYLADFAELATVAGQLALAPQPLTGPLTDPPAIDAEALVNTDVQQSPAVQRARADVDAAEARLRSATREPVPDLQVKAGEWYSGETLGATNKSAGPMSFAEASVQLPLWNRNQGNIAAARAELQRARENVTRVQLMTRHQAEPLAQQYQMARSTADRYRTGILPRARRAYQLETLKYQQMAESYPSVLSSEHMLLELQITLLHTFAEEWSSVLSLQNYTLTHSLEEQDNAASDSLDRNRPTDQH